MVFISHEAAERVRYRQSELPAILSGKLDAILVRSLGNTSVAKIEFGIFQEKSRYSGEPYCRITMRPKTKLMSELGWEEDDIGNFRLQEQSETDDYSHVYIFFATQKNSICVEGQMENNAGLIRAKLGEFKQEIVLLPTESSKP